ncbi:amidohydrolase [Candidatus Sumerlaeota bacterium]|nr:amidohydrolase [Candidatus Sumerlaeota bacterium]
MNTTVFTNGRIYSFSAASPLLWGFKISNGRILEVYEDSSKFSGKAEIVDLQRAVVFPSFTDSHIHLLMLAEALASADLSGSVNEQDAVERLRRWANEQNIQPGSWIRGRGWSFNDWTPAQPPTRRSLDSAFPDNPVVLFSKCGHLIWVNSRALAVSGLEEARRSSLEKWGEQISFFDDDTPSGVFKEDAECLILEHVPELTEEQKLALLQKTLTYLNRFGILSVHNPESFDSLDLLIKAIASLPEFSLRIAHYISTDDILRVEKSAKEINNDPTLNSYIRIEGIKLFVDGSLGGRTAWLSSPYEDEPDNSGICVTEYSELLRLVYEANKRSLSAAVHAIGDRAISLTLQVFQETAEKLKKASLPPVRNRIEHYQLVNPEILSATAQLLPVISMQPLHLAGDWQAADRHWGARSRFAYAFASALSTRAPLIFGSDAPVESPNPWWGVYAAVNRQDLNNNPTDGWYPEEKISLTDALQAYVSTPPLITKLNAMGKIKKNYFADFILLADDPYSMSPHQLHKTRIVGAYFNGKKIFGDL